MRGFINFVREQGVVGLAIGFILGGAAQQLVSSLSKDLITPAIGVASGRFGDLSTASTTVAGATFGWGNFLANIIHFILMALVVYLAFRVLPIRAIDKPKQ